MPSTPGGGVPSSPIFYKNPQFFVSCDRTKVPNWAANCKTPFDCLISYTSADPNVHVKTFLCHATLGNYRISTINDETIVDKAVKSDSYKP